MGRILNLKQLPVDNSKVLVRVDFNVPLDSSGKVLDNTRIQAALPTIRHLLSKNASVILMSHLGRPEGKPAPEFSLRPVADELSHLLSTPVKMAPDCIGPEVEEMVRLLKPGEILLLENLRFHPEEENPNAQMGFAHALAKLGNFYVNDAFGSAHRAHTSVADLPKLFPNKAGAGFLMEKEIAFLGSALKDPDRPFLTIIGGAKVSTKIGALKALFKQADIIAIGGAMAFTFLKTQGIKIGDSLVENDYLEEALKLMRLAEERKVKLLLPVDIVIAEKSGKDAKPQVIEISKGIPDGYKGFDIGPKTINEFTSAIQQAHTILWNGPMGVFEEKPFSKGTTAICKAFIASGGITIAGGGETLAAINETKGKGEITHLSTGGGATLEYIEKGTLPGLEALKNG